MSKITDFVSKHIAPIIEALGYEVVDIEYKDEFGAMTMTFYIYSDKEGGTTLDDCERVHHAIDAPLDELDPTGGEPYNLNVSSPGLDRPFKKPRDFERNLGKEVEIRLYAPHEGAKEFEGKLSEFSIESGGYSLVLSSGNKNIRFVSSQIARIRPLVKF